MELPGALKESMDYEVRKIHQSDTGGFHAALNSVINERKFLLTTEAPRREDTDWYVRNNIANNYAHFVGLLDSVVVGWADIIPYQKELVSHVGLLGMGIVSEHRSRGLGKALLSKTISHARQTGCKRIELEVFARNSVAISLYQQSGFEHEGTKRRGRCMDGRYEDVWIMGLWCG